MNYVNSFNIFGVEAKEIPCIPGKGAPTTATEGAVGCLYMNVDTGDTYKCVAAADGVYTWEKFDSTAGIFIAEYNRTTWEELKAAYDAGKYIVVNRNDNYYGLYAADSTRMEFRQPGTANTPYVRCTNAGDWDYGYYSITPEDIGAMPGYKGLIAGSDLNDYTSPGTYKIEKEHNDEVANAPFVGEVATFLQVIPFRENPTGNEADSRVLQEAITDKHGGVDRKWRVKSVSEEGGPWSRWQDSCEVYIATYDASINTDREKVQEAWNLLTWMFGRSDDGLLQGRKTVFCRYQMPEDGNYEYYMLPLSKITQNYASFRGMTSDKNMITVYLRNPDSFDSTKWGWRSTTPKPIVDLTEIEAKITGLETRLAEAEEKVEENGSASVEDGSLVVGGGSGGNAETIAFRASPIYPVNVKSGDFAAEKGMTWGEFIASDYNTALDPDGCKAFVIENDVVRFPYQFALVEPDEDGCLEPEYSSVHAYGGELQTADMVIEPDGDYYSLTAGTGLITFTYYGSGTKEYTAEDGMTWKEFVDSNLNPTSELDPGSKMFRIENISGEYFPEILMMNQDGNLLWSPLCVYDGPEMQGELRAVYYTDKIENGGDYYTAD